ncbi:hypothetical protein [Halostella salina]|uniref:hypothetical protein n=1 Tax=Halostella salina TaxID=1547897 RepID=UPI0013CF305A|nr:hypothetical protein [Halostella salina]
MAFAVTVGLFVLSTRAASAWLYEATGIAAFEDPEGLGSLFLLGGPLGGLVAGYLVRDGWDYGLPAGARAGGWGLAAVYLAYAAYHLTYYLLVGLVPPPAYDVVVVPLLFVGPFLPVHLFGGAVGGVVGDAVGRVLAGERLV